jgi:hypothetical protein
VTIAEPRPASIELGNRDDRSAVVMQHTSNLVEIDDALIGRRAGFDLYAGRNA